MPLLTDETGHASSDEARMTFTEHLAELRKRIIRSAIALVVGFAICYALFNPIFEMIRYPLGALEAAVSTSAEGSQPAAALAPKAQWITLNPMEPILVKLKLSGFAGLLLASPFIVYQICAFVFPGLKPNEKRLVSILLAGCSMFAVVGVVVAYIGIVPFILPFLLQMTPPGVVNQLRMTETISFILKFLGAFALAFQFPMAVMVLVYMDLLTPATLKHYRRIAIVVLAVASAMLTPPDPFSMIVMLLPLMLLYESSIWISYIVIKRKKQATAVTKTPE